MGRGSKGGGDGGKNRHWHEGKGKHSGKGSKGGGGLTNRVLGGGLTHRVWQDHENRHGSKGI